MSTSSRTSPVVMRASPASNTFFSINSIPTSVEHGDLNGDGLQDIVYCSLDTTFASIHPAIGGGDLQEQAETLPLAGATKCFDLKMGDFNADGVLDVVSAHRDANAPSNNRLVFRFSNP